MMSSNVSSKNPQSAIRNPQSKILYWLPPLLWMAAIFYFSTDTFSGENTGSLLWRIISFVHPGVTEEQFSAIHFYLRKAAHFMEYALLALLLFRAFRAGAITSWRWRWALGSWLIVVVYALADEYHQTFTRHRVGSIYDSLTDIAGGMSALLALWLIRRRRGN
ncbi:MAG: VanZ family protein [Blastocatellia bacterium]